MNLLLDSSIGKNYKSASQKARVITEDWIARNAYCPRCRYDKLRQLRNNRPVSDFICDNCGNVFESKAKKDRVGLRVVDGAYDTMIKRIYEKDNPDFFFMSYNPDEGFVNDFIVVPKYFFTEKIIERRKPLSANARRAGWVGCNILLDNIPNEGKINIICSRQIFEKDVVCANYSKTFFISNLTLTSRGWLMDVMHCINEIGSEVFHLTDLYKFEEQLKLLHPQNNHIQAKIRQQLQMLRDRGFIDFLGNGNYKKSV